MGHVKEPPGIDLIIEPMPLSEEDRHELSAVIARYKQTKKVPKSKPLLTEMGSKKKVIKLSKKKQNAFD